MLGYASVQTLAVGWHPWILPSAFSFAPVVYDCQYIWLWRCEKRWNHTIASLKSRHTLKKTKLDVSFYFKEHHYQRWWDSWIDHLKQNGNPPLILQSPFHLTKLLKSSALFVLDKHLAALPCLLTLTSFNIVVKWIWSFFPHINALFNWNKTFFFSLRSLLPKLFFRTPSTALHNSLLLSVWWVLWTAVCSVN